VGGEAPVTPVSSPDSSPWTFPTNRAITVVTRGIRSIPLFLKEVGGFSIPELLFSEDGGQDSWMSDLARLDGTSIGWSSFPTVVIEVGSRMHVDNRKIMIYWRSSECG
jgi:hypothetical protein